MRTRSSGSSGIPSWWLRASNAVTNDSAKFYLAPATLRTFPLVIPTVGVQDHDRARMCSNPNTVVVRAGELARVATTLFNKRNLWWCFFLLWRRDFLGDNDFVNV